MPVCKSGFWRQVRSLATKDLTILILRHFSSTLYTAVLLPVLLTIYLGIGQNLQGANNDYGITNPQPIRSLEDGLRAADSQRSHVVFVNNGFADGDINRVIDALDERVVDAGKSTHRAADVVEMSRICSVSFQGTTPCYGAVVFNGSPSEGDEGVWNYTLRGDVDLGRKFDVGNDDNDPQIYVLPLQRAVDLEIARLNGSDADASFFERMEELIFTNQTEAERKIEATRDYQSTFINYMGVAVLLAFFGLPYHLPGYIATEREKGLSALIDSMMVTKSAWEPQAIRMVSYFASFSTTYFSGWVAGSLILKFMVWKETSVGVVLPYFVLAGFAATSQALIGGTLFRKAQLSGVTNGLVFLLLGVLVQAISTLNTAGAAILGLLFTPCNMVLQIKYMARYEANGRPTNLLEAPADSDHSLPALALWMFLLFQIGVSPLIAAWLERWLHGVAADSRIVWTGTDATSAPQDAVCVQGLTKIYRPSLLRRLFGFLGGSGPTTVAVDNLNMTIPRGQIVALLGANGSGKSTTLDAVAGIQGFSKGRVIVDASGGIGIAPQKNVMWDELTTIEHVRLFNQLKSPFRNGSDEEIQILLKDVGLTIKKDAMSKTLSGGQQRKLQLAMMLIGDSSVCCIDEVSSGIDPLSRRRIWDILLAERGKRTIILTTHFLDEADLLSDKVVIMSKGKLCADGSAVSLKAELGSGYRIHLSNPQDSARLPEIEGVRISKSDGITYLAPNSELAAHTIRALEQANINYRLSSPTLEDIFLKSAEEYANEASNGLKRLDSVPLLDDCAQQRPLELLTGRQIGMPKQAGILMVKRFTLLKSNWLPYLIAFLIPVVAASVMQLLVSGEEQTTCTPLGLADLDDFNDVFSNATILAGPESSVSNLSTLIEENTQSEISLETIDSFPSLQSSVERNRQRLQPGGFWAGSSDSPPVVVYRADENFMQSAVIAQNLLDSIRAGIDIIASYAPFDTAFGAVGKTLQLSIYFSIAFGLAPTFLSLYPNLERRTLVRSLQYSSGVRVLSQWASHLIFDFCILLLPAIAAALIFAFATSVFWNPGYLVPVFLLYAVAATLAGYIVSLVLGSQLATWAAGNAFNGVGVAIYFISFLFIISLSDATKAQSNIDIAHYVIAIIFPGGSLIRAMLVSLNVFSQACDGSEFISQPGAMNAYGAPILYLAIQSVVYFCILLLCESKSRISALFSSRKPRQDPEKVATGDCGVQVQGLTKTFGDLKAVDDVSFDIGRSEVFALLGPNGAGKSTTISLIRGNLHPTKGDVLVEQISITQNRALARANMGVCPQFDALDDMTTQEHLQHYARLRGIADVPRQVDAVINAVGLDDYRDTMAAHLSGGNKRKLSLGIALTGNPSVILLDEPSSGLDAAAKRVMWHTLKTVMPGRSILLTTHSMEEADTLASRAGIVAKQMLAMGKVEDLQRCFGDSLHVHLVSRTAPYSTAEEMQSMRALVLELFPDADVEEKTYHGQMRFSVPSETVRVHGHGSSGQSADSAIGQLLVILEENKDRLGITHHSVAPTTLNDVFLAIVGQHQVQEEGYQQHGGSAARGNKRKMWRKALIGF